MSRTSSPGALRLLASASLLAVLGCDRSDPRDRPYTSVSVSTFFWCGIETTGALTCVADREEPLLPVRSVEDTPEGTFTSVDTIWGEACALEQDGSAVCWNASRGGWDVQVPDGAYQQVLVGGDHVVALDTEGVITA